MKIGIISRWNATCGISMHAELIVNEFIKLNHDVKVFAPTIQTANKWWHHKIIRENEEDFVIRCYDELDPNTFSGGYFNEEVIKDDFDLIIVESYASIPYSEVEKAIEKINCPKIAIIHEGRREDIKYKNLRSFDALVVFDERYVRELLWDLKDITRIIPFPCYPVNEGKREFGEDITTFFSFGRQPEEEYLPYILALDSLSKRYNFVYRIVRSDGELHFKRGWIKQERRRLTNKEVYNMLHNSDVHLIPKGYTNSVVMSTTLNLCLGSLVPTVVPATRHFEMFGEKDSPVVKFKDPKDLEKKLERIIRDETYREELKILAKEYVENNRCDKIAKKFIELYKELQFRNF